MQTAVNQKSIDEHTHAIDKIDSVVQRNHVVSKGEYNSTGHRWKCPMCGFNWSLNDMNFEVFFRVRIRRQSLWFGGQYAAWDRYGLAMLDTKFWKLQKINFIYYINLLYHNFYRGLHCKMSLAFFHTPCI